MYSTVQHNYFVRHVKEFVLFNSAAKKKIGQLVSKIGPSSVPIVTFLLTLVNFQGGGLFLNETS